MANVNIATGGLPPSLSPAFNPIVFRFESDVLGAGSKASGSITVFGCNQGDTITFDGVVFECKDIPGYNEFLSTASGTPSDIAQSIVDAINENFNLNYKYIATRSGGVVNINALENGTDFNQTIVSSTASLVAIGMIGGTDQYRAQEEENYGIYLDVYMQNGGGLLPGYFQGNLLRTNGVPIAKLHQKFDGDNEFVFDISNIVNAYVDSDPPLSLQSTIQRQNLGANNFFVKYGEEYSVSGSPFIRKYEIATESDFWHLNAAIPYEQNTNLSGYSQITASTLSNQPTDKRVFSDQTDFLNMFYFNSISTESLTVVINFTFEDGTTYSQYYFPTSSLDDGIIYADVGPANINIPAVEAANFNKTVVSYEAAFFNYTGIWTPTIIVGTVTQISEYQNYVINTECQDFQTKIAWLNRLGGFDSFHFIGNNKKSINVDRNTYTSFENNQFNSPAIQLKQLNTESFDLIETSSGWLTQDEADWLKELLTSTKTYINEGNAYKEIIIQDYEWGYDEKSKLYTLKISWRYAQPINSQFDGK